MFSKPADTNCAQARCLSVGAFEFTTRNTQSIDKKSKFAMFFSILFSPYFKNTVFYKCFVFRRSFLSHMLELCRAHHKRLYILQEINQRRLQIKKCFFTKNWGWDQELEVKGYVLVQKVQFFEETVKERGSMYEHFPLCGSARAAIPGRLLTKEFSNKNRFSEMLTLLVFLRFCGRVILGVF